MQNAIDVTTEEKRQGSQVGVALKPRISLIPVHMFFWCFLLLLADVFAE